MSSIYLKAYPNKQKCEWCSRQTDQIEKMKTCRHIICDRCSIKDGACQSNCPACWEENITRYLSVSRICAVCCTGIKSTDPLYLCLHRHPHCPQCVAIGCRLCQFCELKAWNDKTYRDLPPERQRILYTCQSWQKKFEETHLSTDSENSFFQDHNNKSSNGSGLSKSEYSKTNARKSIENDDCMICLERLGSSRRKLDVCGHYFHPSCIDQWFQSSGKQSCPTCGHVYGISTGPQPSGGRMTKRYLPTPLPGFENDYYGHKEMPTIEITYSFPSGKQGPLNPNPGQIYSGTSRRAYLPNNKEGKEILHLLERAFNDQHVFTIGRSVTSGQENVITWNDVHHKTSITGGPERFGYPDPTYLYRIRQELADKGYK